MSTSEEAKSILLQAYYQNRWFEEVQVRNAIQQWEASLTASEIDQWVSNYQWPTELHNKHLGVIMAGNVPLVGLHDLVVGVLTGFRVRKIVV